MSDEEIKLDLQQQRFEKALAGELEKTLKKLIKKQEFFNTVDKLYGNHQLKKVLKKEQKKEPKRQKKGRDDFGYGWYEDLGADMGGEDRHPLKKTPTAEPEPAAEGFNVEKGFSIINGK